MSKSSRRRSFSKKAQVSIPSFLQPFPAEIKVALPVLISLERSTIQNIIKAASAYLKGKEFSTEMSCMQAEALGMEVTDYGKVFTAVYLLLRTIVGKRITGKTILDELPGLGLTPEVVQDIVRVVKAQRSSIEDVATGSAQACPRLTSTRWRVDVAISTSSLNKCLKPSILMQLGLSNGKLKNFELPIDKFHDLRFNVAKALRAVRDLESHPLIRVINHVDNFEREQLEKEK
jgi:COMM domain containing 5